MKRPITHRPTRSPEDLMHTLLGAATCILMAAVAIAGAVAAVVLA